MDELNKNLKGMTVLKIEDCQRSLDLQQKRSYWKGSQHDHLMMNWDGAGRQPGVSYVKTRQALQGFIPVNAATRGDAPSWLRRPDCPVPLGRQVVSRFTEMVIPISDGQVPAIRVWGDEDTQEYVEAVFKKARIWEGLMWSRDMSGSQGCSAILNGLTKGQPFIEVLDPAYLWVAEWDTDVPWWRPKVVVEQVKVTREGRNDDTGELEEKDYWETRAWTPEATITYQDVECDKYKEGDVIGIDEVIPHPLGRCPVVWYSNSLDQKSPFGEPDYDGVYEKLDKIDRLESQVHKGSNANVEPTLVIKEDQRSRRRNIIEKGKVIGVAADGDAKYLEIQGSSIETAQKQLDREMDCVLQTTQCVIISSNDSSKLQSSESMQMLWRSMESRANRLRTPLVKVVEEIADIWCRFAEEFKIGMDLLGTKKDKGLDGKAIVLPPRRDSEKIDTELSAHKLGKGGKFTIDFQPFFRPTPQQIAAVASAMSTATGAKQYLSTETATRTMCSFLSRDGAEEVVRLEEEKEEEEAKFEEQMEKSMDLANKQQAEDQLDTPTNKGGARPGSGMPAGSPGKPKSANDVARPAAKAKTGKRGPGRGR